MNQQLTRAQAYRMIELIAAALDIPDRSDIAADSVDEDLLYAAARKHRLTALTAAGLKKLDIPSEKFSLSLFKAKHQSVLTDKEYRKVAALLEEKRIPFLPLKGVLLKSLYPETGLREMSDIDILFDASRCKDVREIMTGEGYEVRQYDLTNHDVYSKAPFYLFEMHRQLCDKEMFPQIYDYLQSRDFLPDGSGGYCGEMDVSDTYLYLIIHTYNHYSSAGIGLKPLIDLFLYLRRYGSQMDRDYLDGELRKIGLNRFEEMVRNLSQKMWRPCELSQEEADQLDYFIFSGAFGTKQQNIRNKIGNSVSSDSKGSKLKYIRSRLTVTDRKVKSSPFYSKHPKLVPLMKFTRPVKAVFTRPKAILYELKVLKKADKK